MKPKTKPKAKPAGELTSLDQLKPAPYNPRTISEPAMGGLTRSMQEFGDISGIVWNRRTGHLVAGHQRLEALKARYGDTLSLEASGFLMAGKPTKGDTPKIGAGFGQFPIRVVDWDAAKEKAANLAANNPLLAGDFTDELGDIIKEIDKDLAEALRLPDLAAEYDFDEPGEVVEDEVPEAPDDPITKPGDLWLLGEHRVLCGDSKMAAGGEYDLVMTDPPYGINVSQMTMGDKESAKPLHARLSTGQTWDAARPEIAGLLGFAPHVCIWGAQYFCRQLPISHDWLCWHKKIANMSFAECELAWTNYGNRCRVLAHHWGGEEKQHITQKPLAVIAWAIEICPDSPTRIYDPFLGSGTTLIAAEQLGRKCYGIEIEPKYVDVVVARWEKLTGKKATLEKRSRKG